MLKSKHNLIIYFLITLVVILGIINENKKVEAHIKDNPTINILLLGTDGNDDENERADAIIIASLNQVKKEISLISIPRDSKVTIPCGAKGAFDDKINHAFAYGDKNWKSKGGGKTCVTQTVENLFNLVDLKYVHSGFNGLKDIVNKLGGVDVIPKTSFCQSGNDKNSYCFTKDKKVNIKGEQFLAFVRHRSTLLRGDLDRTANQRLVLLSLFNKVRGLSKFKQIELTIYALTKTQNNLALSELLSYTKINFKDYQFKSIMLQGSDVYSDVYYYELNRKHVQTVKGILKGD